MITPVLLSLTLLITLWLIGELAWFFMMGTRFALAQDCGRYLREIPQTLRLWSRRYVFDQVSYSKPDLPYEPSSVRFARALKSRNHINSVLRVTVKGTALRETLSGATVLNRYERYGHAGNVVTATRIKQLAHRAGIELAVNEALTPVAQAVLNCAERWCAEDHPTSAMLARYLK